MCSPQRDADGPACRTFNSQRRKIVAIFRIKAIGKLTARHRGYARMNTSGRSRRGPTFRSSLTRTCLMHGRDFRLGALILPLASVMAVFTVAAHADEMKPASARPPAPRAAPANPTVQARPVHPRGRTANARFAHGAVIARHYRGRHYRGRVAWEGGRWHRGVHDGRAGWWWDVGGVWYYYTQRMA